MTEQTIIQKTEKTELAHAEARIERTMRHAWLETSIEYQRIRDNDLYKQEGWATWAEYTQERWNRTSQHIDQQIARAREVLEIVEISTIPQDSLPASMSHATALSKLDKTEYRAEVWKNVLINANGRGVTAKMVEDEVKRFQASLDKNWITLTEWEAGERWHGPDATSKMNKVNENIEWAAWSWNPITGCLHNCPYCYARDIANRFYPQEFEPSFIPSRLVQPDNTIPDESSYAGDKIFTCSMADLWGKWVPVDWIESVLKTVSRNPQWTFLMLTKFPIRMAEFDYPSNVWLGTSVDRQHAVDRAQKAFIKIKQSGFDGVCWLSCEPMLERLTFDSLDMFDWVVMGGASKSTQTPEYRPPFDDIVHLYQQARSANCQVYMKTNLLGERLREYPNGL